MDPKTVYWTAALLNMAVLAGFALAGVRHARRGEWARHQRAMTVAALLVGAFLLSYPLKLAFLGREDMAGWSPLAVGLLRVHELCVLVMLLAGATAFVRGRRLRRTRALRDDPDAPPATPGMRRGHRRAGRTAVVAAVLGWALAGAVLVGMYARA